MRWLCLSPLLLALLFATQAAAHQRGSSYSAWDLRGAAPTVSLRLSQLELTRLELHPAQSATYRPAVAAMAQARLQLSRAGQPCRAGAVSFSEPEPGWLQLHWTLQCAATSGSWQIATTLFLPEVPGHVHFARLLLPDRQAERLLSRAQPVWVIDAEVSGSGMADYLWLGLQHIAGGWDHLAFVAALLLLATRLQTVAWLVTGFTVGHSLTLGLAAFGWLQPQLALVELMIAWSIALMAAENLFHLGGRRRGMVWAIVALGVPLFFWLPVQLVVGMLLFTSCYFGILRRCAQPLRLRAAVTLAFGLVHGLGFATVMSGLALPAERLLPALFGFNVGVELGQLLFVLLLWPLVRRLPATAVAGLSAALLALAVMWLGGRL